MAAALRDGEECWVTLRNYRRDGSPFWNEVFLTPVHDADGVARRYIGVLHDVTARVTSAVELEEAEARYRTLIETIPAVTYIADWDEMGSFRYVSPQIEELLGFPARATGSATRRCGRSGCIPTTPSACSPRRATRSASRRRSTASTA